MRKAPPQQISLLPPDAATLLHLVRENLRLLAELATHYEVPQAATTGDRLKVTRPADVADYLGPEMRGLAQEQLRVVLLDTKNRVLATPLIYQGGLNSVVIRLGDVFREAVACGAAALILVHNHPSKDATPSTEDIRLTQDAARVGEILGVQVLDHIIVAGDGYVSLREKGMYVPSAVPAAH